jgi:hypothetical protein
MGSSSSKSAITQKIENQQITKSDLDLLNQQISEFVSENVISNASKCAASSAQVASLETGSIVAKGKDSVVTLGDEAEQKTNITLDCLQKNLQQSNINNNIASSIMSELSNNISADTMTKLISQAESGASTGFANPLAFADSESKVDIDLKNIQMNETNKKLQNVIKNSVTNVTKNTNVSECATKISQNLSRKLGDILALEGGKVEVQFTTKQVAESIAKCQQLNNQVADVTSALATTLGVKITETQTQKATTESEAAAKSEAKTEGVGDVLGSIFAGLFAGIAGPYVISSSVVSCIIIILSLVVFFLFRGSGGSDYGQLDQYQEYYNQQPEQELQPELQPEQMQLALINKQNQFQIQEEEQEGEQEGEQEDEEGQEGGGRPGYFIKKFLNTIKENKKIYKW